MGIREPNWPWGTFFWAALLAIAYLGHWALGGSFLCWVTLITSYLICLGWAEE